MLCSSSTLAANSSSDIHEHQKNLNTCTTDAIRSSTLNVTRDARECESNMELASCDWCQKPQLRTPYDLLSFHLKPDARDVRMSVGCKGITCRLAVRA